MLHKFYVAYIVGNGLSEHRNQIAAAVQSASTRGDSEWRSSCGYPLYPFSLPISYPAISQQLLSKIDHVLSLTERDNISTSKVSTLLNLLSKAYKYSCSVTQDLFSLHGASVKALDNSDSSFKRFLSRRMTKDNNRAKEELMSCEQFAGRLTNTCKHIIN